MSFLGAILPSWGYHLREHLSEVGSFFLSVNVGFLVATFSSQAFFAGGCAKRKLVIANVMACGGFLFLAMFSPPASGILGSVGLFWLGASIGLLNSGVFQAVSPLYQRDRATTTNLASVIFGLGCLVAALLVWGTYYVYTVPSILILFALAPGYFAGFCAKAKLPGDHGADQAPFAEWRRNFKNPGIVLFTALLFFQFANEWSIAGWLPLFLIRRLGISPETSLLLLALYWGVLLIGRIASQLLMRQMSQALLLLSSMASALLGIVVLASTNNRFGAVMGILFVGTGFAFIIPLIAVKVGRRFPDYHAGLYNGLFSIALTGGLLAPWLLGYMAEAWGIQAVMLLPLAGICLVFVFSLLIQLESKLAGFEESKKAEA